MPPTRLASIASCVARVDADLMDPDPNQTTKPGRRQHRHRRARSDLMIGLKLSQRPYAAPVIDATRIRQPPRRATIVVAERGRRRFERAPHINRAANLV